MVDSNFFPRSKKLTLQQISKLTKITLPKSVDKNRVFIDISPLDSASKDNISFLDNKNYINQFKKSKAGACFFRKDFKEIAPKNMIPLISTNPYHSFAIVANAFYPIKNIISSGAHATAHIENTVSYDDTVQISPGAIISNNVVIGSNSFIGANTVIAAKSAVFESIKPNSFISGIPAKPHKNRLRQEVIINQLPEILNRLRKIEKNEKKLLISNCSLKINFPE